MKNEQLNNDFIISLTNADVKIQGHTLLSGITWQLRRGEHWALIGGNGAGKSTLLRLIRGELWLDRGATVSDYTNFMALPRKAL